MKYVLQALLLFSILSINSYAKNNTIELNSHIETKTWDENTSYQFTLNQPSKINLSIGAENLNQHIDGLSIYDDNGTEVMTKYCHYYILGNFCLDDGLSMVAILDSGTYNIKTNDTYTMNDVTLTLNEAAPIKTSPISLNNTISSSLTQKSGKSIYWGKPTEDYILTLTKTTYIRFDLETSSEQYTSIKLHKYNGGAVQEEVYGYYRHVAEILNPGKYLMSINNNSYEEDGFTDYTLSLKTLNLPEIQLNSTTHINTWNNELRYKFTLNTPSKINLSLQTSDFTTFSELDNSILKISDYNGSIVLEKSCKEYTYSDSSVEVKNTCEDGNLNLSSDLEAGTYYISMYAETTLADLNITLQGFDPSSLIPIYGLILE